MCGESAPACRRASSLCNPGNFGINPKQTAAVCAYPTLILARRWLEQYAAGLQAKRSPAEGSQILEATESVADEGGATLLVITQDAFLYTYQIQNLSGARNPTVGLEDECYVLAGRSDITA